MHSNIFFHLILMMPSVGESLLPPTNWITCDELSIAVFYYILMCVLLYVLRSFTEEEKRFCAQLDLLNNK